MIAQVPAAELESLVPFIKSLGVPGAWLLVAAWTIRKIVLWITPHLEKLIGAHISRQKTMEECQVKLTESTIEIQKENQQAIKRIEEKLPALCQARHRQPQAGPRGKLP